MLRHLDLFSGIGGWTLGFHATNQIQTVGFCEIEKFPQAVLKHHYPNIPIFEDIRELDYERMESAGLFRGGGIDVLTCSYPCQPFSVAGKKRGEEDSRHLWPEVYRLIRDDRIRPMYVLGENVGGHIRLGLDSVCEDMESYNYRWRCFSIEAACIGANHRRQRVWWIAEDVEHTNNTGNRTSKRRADTHRQKEDQRRQGQSWSRSSGSSKDVVNTDNFGSLFSSHETEREGNTSRHSEGEFERGSAGLADTESNYASKQKKNKDELKGKKNIQKRTRLFNEPGRESSIGAAEDVADTNNKRLQGRKKIRNTKESREKRKQLTTRQSKFLARGNWDVEPNVGRVANGVPNRVHRLKALGNAIVPQMAYYIGLALLENEKRFFNN
jgi:DNA (cytosine-5)-methyltransferase 1